MSRIFRIAALGLAMSLPLFATGCAEDNEKSAAIKGTAPTDGKTDQQRLEDMKAAGAGSATKGAGTYPGAPKK